MVKSKKAKKEAQYQDLERPSLSPWNRDDDEGFLEIMKK